MALVEEPVGVELQVSRQDLKLVQHFGEKGKLLPFEDFVSYFLAGSWVVNPVVIFVPVSVQVVVFH